MFHTYVLCVSPPQNLLVEQLQLFVNYSHLAHNWMRISYNRYVVFNSNWNILRKWKGTQNVKAKRCVSQVTTTHSSHTDITADRELGGTVLRWHVHIIQLAETSICTEGFPTHGHDSIQRRLFMHESYEIWQKTSQLCWWRFQSWCSAMSNGKQSQVFRWQYATTKRGKVFVSRQNLRSQQVWISEPKFRWILMTFRI
jgi:hypothetical protein